MRLLFRRAQRTGGFAASATNESMDETQPPRVELYVRSLAPCESRAAQDAIVERLLALERKGVVDEVDLTVWGDAVCLDGASARVGLGEAIADRIRTFHEWCRDTGVSLDPFFTWSSVDASIAGESHERVVPPHRCLAVYAGDTLREVYPCSVGGTPRSLEDGLRALERGAVGRSRATAVPE